MGPRQQALVLHTADNNPRCNGNASSKTQNGGAGALQRSQCLREVGGYKNVPSERIRLGLKVIAGSRAQVIHSLSVECPL